MLMITITVMTTLKKPTNVTEHRFITRSADHAAGPPPARHRPFSQPRRYQPSTTVSGAAICSSGLPSASMPNTISTSPPTIMMPPPTT
jgi:hypothetical protein